MFTTEQRETIRSRVLDYAMSDPRVTGGALTGSMALAQGDQWSDIDVAFGIADGTSVESVLGDWTQFFEGELRALHHWDLRAGASVYRVFLLPSGLEVDVGMSPQQEFGARGPNFRLLFGTARQLEPGRQPDPRYLIGLAWHHIIHARVSIERGKPWRAEYWISALRDHALGLACLRLGKNADYAREFDILPASLTEPFEDALVRSLDKEELRRALSVATSCFVTELGEWDPALCERLKALLEEYGSPGG